MFTGGTAVTITGAGFSNGLTSVKFGSSPAVSFSVMSDKTATALTPAHAAGVVDVTVTTLAGTTATTPADQFTYVLFRTYFQWFDMASPGMVNDNIHLLNTSANPTNITVTMPGAVDINVPLAAGATTYVSFGAGHIGGPVVVNSDQPILASQRVQYYQTFNEVWGQSATQASTASYVNWYDKASPGMFNDNIHLLNPGTNATTVTVTVPGAPTQTAMVAPGAETYVTFPVGTIGGPVKVSSTQPVLASQRVGYNSSFNEVWAANPGQTLTTGYFNWYDKASPGMFNDNIHLLNPGTAISNVTVTLPGAPTQTMNVAPGAEAYVNFPQGTIGGPVTLSATQPILASQRVQYFQTFNEVWAANATQASRTSYFTWYDKASAGMLNDNIHLVNPGTWIAMVTVTLPGGNTQMLPVGAGEERYVNFSRAIGGPVTVTVTSGPPVLASQRVQYYDSFNEVWAGSP
jgi:hypothetical protein